MLPQTTNGFQKQKKERDKTHTGGPGMPGNPLKPLNPGSPFKKERGNVN